MGEPERHVLRRSPGEKGDGRGSRRRYGRYRMGRVTDRERYFFDTRGYLVVRGLLTAPEVAHYNALLDRVELETIADPDGATGE